MIPFPAAVSKISSLVAPHVSKISNVAVPDVVSQAAGANPITSSMVATALARGGAAAAKECLDLTRVRVRLEGLHSYGVVTALLMGTALRMFSYTPRKLVPGDRVNNVAKILFAFIICVSVTTGSYTTILLNLLGLYSKRALGVGSDAKFLEFFEATRDLRSSGYDSFVICVISFKLAFSLSLFLSYEGDFKWMIAGFAVLSTLGFWWKWATVMSLANTILFS